MIPVAKVYYEPEHSFVDSNRPILVTCYNCNQTVYTKTINKASWNTYILSIIMWFIFCPLFCIPCIFPETQDVEHYCPNCNIKLITKYF